MTSHPGSAALLVVEDRPEVRELVVRTLRAAGFIVHEADAGDAALARAAELSPDLVVLDVGLPGRDGIQVAQELRARGFVMPVLMLTARARVADRVEGLDAGADDYLMKPFDPDELVARVRALLRRAMASGEGARIRVGDLVVDPRRREAFRGTRRIALSQKEYALLELLARHAGQPVSRETIAEQVWRTPYDPGSNVTDVYVSYLRAKLGAGGEPELVHTVRGTGYVLQAPPDAAGTTDGG